MVRKHGGKHDRSKRKYGGKEGTSQDTKVKAKKKRAEKHKELHPNDKGIVNKPSGICKCCSKHWKKVSNAALHNDWIEKIKMQMYGSV